MSNHITSSPSSGIWHSNISNNQSWNLLLLCFFCLMIPPLFLPPPVDKSFSFIARLKGCRCTGHKRERRWGDGGVRGWRVGGTGVKENGQSGDKRGSNRALLPWFNLYTPASYPWPLPSPRPCSYPRPPLCFARLPRHTWRECKLRVVLPGTTKPLWVCVAEWPCGGSSPFFLNQ